MAKDCIDIPEPSEFRFDLPGGRRLESGGRPVIMGILNVTPDSFSDGGMHEVAEVAVRAGLEMIAEGAHVLDIGGESTRPGAHDVEVKEQLRRILPVIEGLRSKTDVPISVDTRSPRVGEEAIRSGADIINDVSACADVEWPGVLAKHPDVPVVLMHMRGTPRTMRELADYPLGVMDEILDFLARRIRHLEERGVDASRMILDPGIGFAKKPEHNLEILRELPRMAQLERPVLVGLSRKLFLGKLLERPGRSRDPSGRDAATIAANMLALQGGASILRVHNVPFARDLLDVYESVSRTCPTHCDAEAGDAEARGADS